MSHIGAITLKIKKKYNISTDSFHLPLAIFLPNIIEKMTKEYSMIVMKRKKWVFIKNGSKFGLNETSNPTALTCINFV
jgi:hypothetical protein